MNDFTLEYLTLARDSLRQGRKDGDPRAVITRAEEMWVHDRDLLIESWVDRILDSDRIGTDESNPAYAHLLRIAPKVFDLMNEYDPNSDWSGDVDAGSRHQLVTMAAWGLGNLRWIHRSMSGREEELETLHHDEVKIWLEASRTYQPTLF